MSTPVPQAVHRKARECSIALLAALHILFPIPGRRAPSSASAGGVLNWFVPIGLAVGLIYVELYRLAWLIFGEAEGVRLLPAVTVWLAGLLLFDRLGAPAFVRCIAVRSPQGNGGPEKGEPRLPGAPGSLSLLIAATILPLLLWMAIPNPTSTWPGMWGRYMNFAYPRGLFRPLILAPVWGLWGWVAAAGVGRAHPDAEPAARVLCAAGAVQRTLGWFVPLLVLTMVYSTRRHWTFGCLIALSVLAVTHVYTVAIARRRGGQTLDTLASSGWVAEMSFLICYLVAFARVHTA